MNMNESLGFGRNGMLLSPDEYTDHRRRSECSNRKALLVDIKIVGEALKGQQRAGNLSGILRSVALTSGDVVGLKGALMTQAEQEGWVFDALTFQTHRSMSTFPPGHVYEITWSLLVKCPGVAPWE